MAWMLVGGFGLLGLCVALLLPPFHLPDERRHWLTAHLRAERLLGGDSLCSQDVALERHFRLKIHFDPDLKVPPGTWPGIDALEPVCEDAIQYRFSNTFSYPGVLLVRWLTPEPATGSGALHRFFAARIAGGLLLLALLARAAILARRDPEGPPPLLLLLLAVPLSPLFVQQSFGVTPDVVVNASALALALWLALGARTGPLDRAALCLLGLVAALTKPVLVPVLPAALLLGLWLEARDAGSGDPGLVEGLRRGISRRPIFTAAVCLVVVAGLATAAASPGTMYKSGLVDGEAQLAFVRENPGTALRVISAGVAKVFLNPSSLVGPLGYLDTPMRAPTRLAFAAILALAAAAEWSGRTRRARPISSPVIGLSLLLAAALAASVGAMAFNMYLMATNVGGETLYGLQPRYLLPHLLVTLGAIAGLLRGRLPVTGTPPRTTFALTLLLAAGITALALSTSLDVVQRYYY